jgi:ABC-2 type transport system ATP-binding protein
MLRLNAGGTTLFVSSHLLAEVEQLCTRVGVMHQGRLVAQESMDDVRALTGRSLVTVGDPAAALALFDGRVTHSSGQHLVVDGVPVPELTRRLVQAGIEVHEAAPERRSLESLVLSLTGPGSDRTGTS